MNLLEHFTGQFYQYIFGEGRVYDALYLNETFLPKISSENRQRRSVHFTDREDIRIDARSNLWIIIIQGRFCLLR